jgi:type II secretory pathway component GspD/PulD (secretin)
MAVNRILPFLLLAAALTAGPLPAQVSESAQGVSVNLVDTDIRQAAQMLAAYLDRPVFFGAIGGRRVTFVSPRPVPRGEIAGLLRSLLAGEGFVMEDSPDGRAYQIRSTQQAPSAPQGPPQPPAARPGGASLASAGGMELFVIRLRHARAADVSATVNALYGRGGALGEPGGFNRSTMNDQLNRNRVAPYGQEGPQVTGAPAGVGGNFTGDVVIVPDSRTNSLLVRANQADYSLIRAAVEQVDVRPLQVLIEATVAYVRRDFTFNWGVEASTGQLPVRGTTNTTIGGETTSEVNATDLVIRALNVGGIDLNLALTAGQSRSSVIILDRPLLLAANNEEAEIVVGEQRPFVQVNRSTDGGVLDAVVQYKDVGTVLRVLPTISSDGYVQLRVVQEVNSAAGSAPGLNAPVISTRAISTQLLVRDGHTVVLGGLSGRQRDRVRGGIPFLSDLPLIGGLFGRRGRDDSDFELFIFITPHVVYSDDDLLDATGDVRGRPAMRRATRGMQPFVSPPPADSVAPAEPVPEEEP